MNKFIFQVALLLLPFLGIAQITTKESAKGKAKEYYDRGDNDYAFGKLWAADSLLNLATREKPDFIDAWILIGQINLEHLHRYDVAAKAYESVKQLQPGYLRDVDYQLAQCYLNVGEYNKAENHLNSFLALEKLPAESKMKATKMLDDCHFAANAIKHPYDFKPVNVGDNVNTPEDESMPSMTADGRFMYFTRHVGTGRNQDEDIYVSMVVHGQFSHAEQLVDINTEQYVEGAQSISPSGKYLLFTSADRMDGLGRADIYMSKKIGDNWERPNNMGSVINSPGWDAQPCISADGRALYFSSIRSGTLGGSDLYVCYLDEKGWSKPENLGSNINTQYDEMRPFIHPDGQTLYFSSNGLPGMGNFDIYMSRKQADGTWGKPVNLGYPINTSGDELGIYITTDGKHAYYASEQKDSYGQKDIYTFDMPGEFRPLYTSYIKGTVYDQATKTPIFADVQIYDLQSGKPFTTLSTDKINGNFLSTLPAGKNYAVEVLKDGYLFYSDNISLVNVTENTPYEVNIPLKKIKVGESIILNNIFFESEEHELKPESKAELGIVIKLLEKNPTLKVEIGGHTDNTGSEDKNEKLSESRAKEVFYYLRNKGIDEARISYKGYASSKPIAPNTSPEGKAKNRRTELVVKEF